MTRAPFDLDLLRTFAVVARTRSFRRAADALDTSQSAVSQQIARLEGQLGQALFARTTRRVDLTAAGDTLSIYARAMLDLAEQTRAHLDRLPNAGVLRLGIVEDFASMQLHRVLRLFRHQYPDFALSVTCSTSGPLIRGLDDGELDVILVKIKPGDGRGSTLWRERAVWVGMPDSIGPDDEPIPLVTYPAPSPTRDMALRALRGARQTWNVVAESSGVTGLVAAVGGGFGVAVFGERLIPPGLAPMPTQPRLPPLGELEFTIIVAEGRRSEAIEGFVGMLTAVTSLIRQD